MIQEIIILLVQIIAAFGVVDRILSRRSRKNSKMRLR